MVPDENCGNCNEGVFEGIQCDGCNVWFHFKCSRLSKEDIPDGDWFCRLCLKDIEIKNLNCIINLLQEDVKNLKCKINDKANCDSRSNSFSQVISRRKGKSSSNIRETQEPSICTNRFSVLEDIVEEQVQESPLHSRPSTKNRILILGSSHARHMGSLVQDAVGDKFKVECICKPNAGLGDVVKDFEGLTKGFSKEDHVVVIGGSGNSLDRDPNYTIGQDLENISKASKHTNVNFIELFLRYDKPSLQSKIRAVNDELWKFSCNHSNLNVTSISSLKRVDFTRFGLHLNFRGKKAC